MVSVKARRWWFIGVAVGLAPLAAHAQTAPAATSSPSAPATAAASPPAAEISEVVVTGSRIVRPDFDAPNPITSFNSTAIQESGDTNLTNFLERVPALTGSRDSTQTSGGNAVASKPFGQAGLNELNLRNLGVQRTLVLIDGRRHVAGEPDSAAVDINSIPTDLIDRVDVLTGGASAVYGADGVSGVVNFLLKRDFEGVTARTQLGISDRGDAGQRFVSLAGGKNFADGRGNVTLAYEYSGDDRLQNDQRSYLREDQRQYLIPNDASLTNPSLPHNILVGNLRYPNESPIGAVDVNGDGIADFNGLGQPYRHGTPASYYSTGGDDTPVAGFYSGDLEPAITRNNVNMLAHYDVSDAFKLSFEGTYARTQAKTYDYYIGTYGQQITLDNPFVPAAISNAAVAAGQDFVNVSRDNIDFGRHGESDLRQTYRAVIDASGRINAHASYDAYYDYGETDVGITKLNEILAAPYAQALDAVSDPTTGQPVCRIKLTNPATACLPVSLFGPGPTSRSALNYFQVNDTSQAAITQQVASGAVNGDFGAFFKLPGGPVQFSVGAEYRRETSQFNPSQNLINDAFVAFTEPTAVAPSGGAFDVYETFAELNAPILQHQRLAEALSVGAAYRFSSYSTIGDTSTWQFNGVYAPIRDITFRGSYGKAVRAPNIGELFQPETGVSAFITDPCTPEQLALGTSYRAANCKATLAAVGATISNALQTPNDISGSMSGNPNLSAETATTWTAGVVLRPSFLHGLTASLDWYDITLAGAINTADPSALATLCVDQPSLNNAFCRSVTRAQGTGVIDGYTVEPENVARFRTAGADLNIDYLIRTADFGAFDLRLVGGYLNKLEFVATPGALPTDNVDQAGQPRFNFNFSPTWSNRAFTVSYNLRWVDAQRVIAKLITDNDPDYAPAAQLRYSDVWQHDVQVSYTLAHDCSVYLGVLNLSDQSPDPGNAVNEPVSALGRYVYAGLKLRMGGR